MANRFILWSVCFWCDRRIARICLWCSYLSTIVCGLSRDHVANKCYQIFYLFGCMKKTCVHRIAEISMSERSDKKKWNRTVLWGWSEWNKLDIVDVNTRLLSSVRFYFLVGTTIRFECRVKYVRECIFTFHSWPCDGQAQAFRSNIFMVFNMRVTFEMDGNFSLHSYCAFAASIYSFCPYFCSYFVKKKIRYRGDIHNVHSKYKTKERTNG